MLISQVTSCLTVGSMVFCKGIVGGEGAVIDGDDAVHVPQGGGAVGDHDEGVVAAQVSMAARISRSDARSTCEVGSSSRMMRRPEIIARASDIRCA